MLGSKSNIICLLNILIEYSDEKHILSMREIISKMNIIYDIKIDRRTVYRLIEVLNLLDYDISTYEENGKGYYIRSRLFETSEVRFLIDRIYSTGFLTPKQSNEMVRKLETTLSVYDRKRYKTIKYINDNKKSNNKELFWTIEQLDNAIEEKKKIKFNYYEYDINKQMTLRREEKYLVNPYQMVFANEKYYLVCNYDKYHEISHYRIDMIKNVEILEDNIKPLPKDFDLNEYSKSLVYMFDGKSEYVEIICDTCILSDVIECFGNNGRIESLSKDSFVLKLNTPPLGIKYWALQYLQYCEVTKPEWLREEIKKSIKNNRYGE